MMMIKTTAHKGARKNRSVSRHAAASSARSRGVKPRAFDTASLIREAEAKHAALRLAGKKPFEGLYGALANSAAFEGDSVALVRTWRDAWSGSR